MKDLRGIDGYSRRAATFLAAISLLASLAACTDTNIEKDVLILSDKSVNSSIKAAGQSLLLVSFGAATARLM